MQKHLEVLDLLAAGKITNQDPRVEEALREAVAFCRGALSLDEAAEAEREHCARVAYTAHYPDTHEMDTPHLLRVRETFELERARARAEGYAARGGDMAERIRSLVHTNTILNVRTETAEAQLSAAQAEIENLTQQVDYYNECGYDTHVELVAAQAEIERLSSAVDTTCAHRDSWFKESVVIETKLTNLRTAAERQRDYRCTYAEFCEAIEESRCRSIE